MGRIADFLAQYPKKNTRKAYRTAVWAFLAHTYRKDRGLPPEMFEDLADRYSADRRDSTQDVISFAASFSGSPPKTVQAYVAAVKEFLVFSGVEFRSIDARRIRKRVPKGGAATVEKEMSPETIRSILHHCSLMMRALLLLLVSSGMRIGEALSLDLDDIDLDGDLGYIAVRGMTRSGGGAKGGVQRYTFCSAEAGDAIREWLKKRSGYLAAAAARGKGIGKIKDPDDTRLFPVSESTVGDAWLNALTAAGLVSRDAVTGRLQLHIHMTRKFFLSQMKLEVPGDVVEYIAGHRGYLTDEYRRYGRKQVEDLYRKGEPYVTIQISDEVRELRTTTDKKMQAHSEILENLVYRNISQEREIKELRNLTEALQVAIQREGLERE